MTGIVSAQENHRVVSGMRVSGRMHLGNYHGALKNWLQLQYKYDCYFFAADWHGLFTNYENSHGIAAQCKLMIEDWLAAGLDPKVAKIFVQSGVPEHAELHLLLSMITPLSWLERVPTYKDQQEKLKEKDLSTYGFLGYPLLQSADILIYKPKYVPVGEDQVAHIEITREIARRFNHLYGLEPDFQARTDAAMSKMGSKNAKLFAQLVKRYKEQGDVAALQEAKALLDIAANLSIGDRERLEGYSSGQGKMILPEPEVLLTKESKFPGLDGQKMSKSYNNTITLTEDPASVAEKIKRMPTDPARVKRTDPGNPEKCPVWALHKIYSSEEVKKWVVKGCTTAGIGCLECKAPLIDSIIAEQKPIIERAKYFAANPALTQSIIQESTERARDTAKQTLAEVRVAMGIAE
ncbi:MAG TPA: tryptophan--tRNA ligase [Gammaproteobacteria bacterium]|nr:tryptophan--tRNA ligase [Gammaproteobacteria bacterium]